MDTKAFGVPPSSAINTQPLRNMRPAPVTVPMVETAPVDTEGPAPEPVTKQPIAVPPSGSATTPTNAAARNPATVAPSAPVPATPPPAATSGGISVPYVVPRTPSTVLTE